MWSRWEQMETDGDREIERLAESLELSLFWKQIYVIIERTRE